MRRLVLLFVVAAAACGGGDDGASTTTSTMPGGRALSATVREEGGPIIVVEATCRFDGDRQMIAQGVVKNAGEKTYHVQIATRFLDGSGVRVEIASDSISDLEPQESARWESSAYSDDARDARECVSSIDAS